MRRRDVPQDGRANVTSPNVNVVKFAYAVSNQSNKHFLLMHMTHSIALKECRKTSRKKEANVWLKLRLHPAVNICTSLAYVVNKAMCAL